MTGILRTPLGAKMDRILAALTEEDRLIVATAFCLSSLWRSRGYTSDDVALAAATVRRIGVDAICRLSLADEDEETVWDAPRRLAQALEAATPGFQQALEDSADLDPTSRLTDLLSRWRAPRPAHRAYVATV